MNRLSRSRMFVWVAVLFLTFIWGCADKGSDSAVPADVSSTAEVPSPAPVSSGQTPLTTVKVSFQATSSASGTALQAASPAAAAPNTVVQITLEVTDGKGNTLAGPLTLSSSVNGTVTTSLTIPSGTGRVFIAKALAADGTVLFQGQATANLSAGVLANVGIQMIPNAIVISPSQITLDPSISQQFVATVVGLSDPNVNWSISGPSSGGGNVFPGAGKQTVYTAPASADNQTVTIRATSASSPGIFGEAVVSVRGTVSSPPPGTVLIQPYSIAIEPGGATAVVTDGICCASQGRLARVDLTTLKMTGPVASGFVAPRGVVIEPGKGTALVGDYGTCCTPSGTLTRVDLATGAKTVIASALNNPTGIALEAGGSTGILFGGSQLLRINLTSGSVTILSNLNASSFVLSPDGRTGLGLTYNGLYRVDLAWGSFSSLPYSLGYGVALLSESADSAFLTQNQCCNASPGGALSRLSLSTGVLQSIGTGLSNPTGMAVEPGGKSILVLEQGVCCTGGVSGPAKITRLSLPAEKVKPLYLGFKVPGGIAGEPAGTALVVDPAGTLTRVDPVSGAAKVITSQLTSPQKAAVESGGATALVTQQGNLARVNLSTGAIVPICTGLLTPTGIAIEAGGASALVAESGAGQLLRCNLSSGAVTVLAVGLSSPQTVGIESGGGSAVVLGANSNGSPIGTLSRVTLSSGIISPVIPTSNCCPYSPTIYDFTMESGGNTALILSWTCCPSAPNQNQLQRLDLKTGTVTSTLFSGLNFTLSQYGQQSGTLTLESSGASVLIAEPGNQRIVRVNLVPQTLTPVVYWLGAPVAIALESSGTTALLLDAAQGRVLRWDSTSGVLTLLASGLVNPMSMAMEPDGKSVLVVEGHLDVCCSSVVQPDKLTRVTLANGALTTVTSLLEMAASVVMGPAGTTALVTETNGRIMQVNTTSGEVTTVGGGLSSPRGMALDISGKSVLVAGGSSCCSSSALNGLVRVTLATGVVTPKTTKKTNDQVAAQADGNTALVTGGPGCCYGGFNSLPKMDLGTGATSPIASGFGGSAPVNESLALALSPSGDSVYVADRGPGRIFLVPLK